MHSQSKSATMQLERDMTTIDRRMALGSIAGAGAALPFGGAAAAARPKSSRRGGWGTDPHGLPAYAFAGDVPAVTRTPAGRSFPLESDPVFLLGNYDLTLFAYASGRLRFVSGEHGWVHLNEATATAPGHSATLKVTRGAGSRTHELLGPGGICASGSRTERTFGCGTARFRATVEPGLTIERILSVAPSTAGERAQPAVVVTVRLTNAGTAALDLDYAETVLSNPTVMANRAPKGGTRPVTFANTARALPGGGGVIGEAAATSDRPDVLTPIDVPNLHNLFPPSLVLMAAPAAGGAGTEFTSQPAGDGAVALVARAALRLGPGETRDIVLVIALKSRHADLAPLERFRERLAPSPTGDWFRRQWADVLAPLAKVPDKSLRAELQWDAHALLAMATYAAYFGQTFIPQGMTYDYVQDANSGPRDHLQHAMAAACFAPGLGRSSILYTLCTMTTQGAIKFTVSGNGLTTNSTWAPSDHQIFLFYAVTEYLRVTSDWGILDEQSPYVPGGERASGTTLEKLEIAFRYLRDHVSTGAHGLVRLLTGDWNDQIYAGLPDGLYRDTAESQMNSAMVMAVMPPLIEQLRRYARTRRSEQAARILRLADEMARYADGVTQAMLRDMEGRSYARRAWLAPGKSLGEDEMFLEPQSFLLQAPGFPLAGKRALLRDMQRRLIDGEVLGPRQRERPRADERMEPGTSENGGFWYSLAGQAIAGVATFDRKAALALLDRMTFRNFARHYPGYWVGQWTAPDTLNAAMVGDIAGLPRPMDGGDFLKMANYCAHPHAWPIYCYFRIRDA